MLKASGQVCEMAGDQTAVPLLVEVWAWMSSL